MDFKPLLPAELLPLPRTKAGRGHRHRQRTQHKREVLEEANRLLRSLNSLDRGSSKSQTTGRPSSRSSSSSSPIASSTGRLHLLVQRLAAAAVLVRRDSALAGLSGAHATSKIIKADRTDRYSFATKSHAQISFQADLMDEPPPDSQVVHLLDVLPMRESLWYADEDNVVRSDFFSNDILFIIFSRPRMLVVSHSKI